MLNSFDTIFSTSVGFPENDVNVANLFSNCFTVVDFRSEVSSVNFLIISFFLVSSSCCNSSKFFCVAVAIADFTVSLKTL